MSDFYQFSTIFKTKALKGVRTLSGRDRRVTYATGVEPVWRLHCKVFRCLLLGLALCSLHYHLCMQVCKILHAKQAFQARHMRSTCWYRNRGSRYGVAVKCHRRFWLHGVIVNHNFLFSSCIPSLLFPIRPPFFYLLQVF